MYRKESFIKFKNYNDNAGVKPKDYLIAIDSSCNLCRHSCRTSYIVESYDMVKSKEKIIDYAVDIDEVWLASNGEVFASKIYKKMLIEFCNNGRKEILILSKGTLLNEKYWDLYLNGYNRVDVVISLDGIEKKTVEKLR